MADEKEDEIKEVEQIKFKSSHWILAGVLLFIMLCIPLIVHFSVSSVDVKAMWGDFFGGTLNPLFTLLTFLALIYTIILQRNELALSRNELELTRKEVAKSSEALNDQNDSMKQQRFETTLFNMIGVLNQIIDQMDVSYGDKKYNGRDCFSFFISNISKTYQNRLKSDIKFSYEYIYKKNSGDLAHYFRVLYNIFKFIHESDYSNPIYAKILRAQLSNQELVILYYNCLSDHGVKFRELAIEFELFDNLNVRNLIRPEHVEDMDRKAFGNNIYFQKTDGADS